jgi:hypothetical protein
MVEMRVRQQDMRGAFQGGVMLRLVQDRVPGQPWVKQQYLTLGFDAEAAMTQPNNFHK